MLGLNIADLESAFTNPLNVEQLNNNIQVPGVEFIPITYDQLMDAHKNWSIMVDVQTRLVAESPSLEPLNQVHPFIFGAFLSEPLTEEQVAEINDRDTPKIAQSCIAFQSQVAKVPIFDSLESMQHIPSAFEQASVSAGFSDEPFPESSGEWAGKPQQYWTRESVVERLIMAAKILEAVGAELCFLEAFRPTGVQEAMFQRRINTTRIEHPDWSEDDVLAEAKTKTASTPRLASHKAGAAVDVFLQSSLTHDMRDFGHGYPDGGALVFPFNKYLTFEQWHNRQLLSVAMGLAGLTMYYGEDWHFSYGDNVAAVASKGSKAQFGPIKDFDRDTGEITATYREDELDRTFQV